MVEEITQFFAKIHAFIQKEEEAATVMAAPPMIITLDDDGRLTEITSENKGAFRRVVPVYIGRALVNNMDFLGLLKDSPCPIMVVDFNGLDVSMVELTQKEIQAKLTGVAHDMRSDVKLPSLAEVVPTMPVLMKKLLSSTSRRRPALTKNRKRDRWN